MLNLRAPTSFTGASRIHRLPEAVIHRIAAGEVADAPASVLKELVENSLDAGAKNIQVTLVEGGCQVIQVDDDGHGMGPDDLCICLERYHTSKLENIDDMQHISTLGFRGEALAAIANVSRLRIESAVSGLGSWLRESVGGVHRPLEPGLRRTGTRVRVENIFFNAPARRKFLRRSSLEAAECRSTLEALALAHPSVRFSWAAVDAQDEIKFEIDLPAKSPADRFRQLTPSKASLIELDVRIPNSSTKARILLLHPSFSQSTRKAVHLSVNGRVVEDRQLPHILRSACAGLIESGRFPVAHVAIQSEASQVDVNVHPKKLEVRLLSATQLWDALYFETRRALGLTRSRVQSPPPTAKPPFRFAELRLLGQSSESWIVCDSPQGLILIDQHAAHERINFDLQMRRSDLIGTRALLTPLRLNLPSALRGFEKSIGAALEGVGFELDPLAAPALEIVAVPQAERHINWDRLLEETLQAVSSGDSATSIADALRVRVASSLACHSSLRRGDPLNSEQMLSLLAELDRVDWGELCPHGRPVWFLLSNEQIASRFHR